MQVAFQLPAAFFRQTIRFRLSFFLSLNVDSDRTVILQ